ncbi:MAG: hypothetical protein AB1467_00290 [Candidatus Diapherotrites archaeon]
MDKKTLTKKTLLLAIGIIFLYIAIDSKLFFLFKGIFNSIKEFVFPSNYLEYFIVAIFLLFLIAFFLKLKKIISEETYKKIDFFYKSHTRSMHCYIFLLYCAIIVGLVIFSTSYMTNYPSDIHLISEEYPLIFVPTIISLWFINKAIPFIDFIVELRMKRYEG